jgi:CheY-like chemotaxis protein
MTKVRALDDADLDLDEENFESGHGLMRESQPVPSRRAASAELLGAVAHDLNNPLAIIHTNLGFLSGVVRQIRSELATGVDERFTSQLAEAELSLQDANEAVQRLRTLARSLAGPSSSLPPPSAPTRAIFFPSPDSGAPRPARVMIVDDEESLTRALSRLFRDYDVVVHVDPTDALGRVASGERFDVIVSDVAMPKMSGCDLYEEIRRIAPEQAERVIFLTGGHTSTRISSQLSSIGQPILSKPFDARELRAFIEKFLKLAASGSTERPALGA